MKRTLTSTQPCFESLEPRLLLDGSVWVYMEADDLIIRGDRGDNAVCLTGLPDGGGYEISGLINGGDSTLINGRHAVNIPGDIPGRILINLDSGDDIFNIGSRAGVNTTVVDLLDIDLGTGANQLNIGRIGHDGRLSYGGEVTITEATTLANGGRGVGNVLIAGAKMQSFEAHMGYGRGERNVTIAGLYYGHASSPPSDIEDIESSFTDITITNPRGMLETLIEDTSAADVSITTSNGDDRFAFRGVSCELLLVQSFSGRDNIQLERTEFRTNSIDYLTLVTDRGRDTIYISDTQSRFGTHIDMGKSGWGSGQTLQISAYGPCELTGVQIYGQKMLIDFNGIAGANETLINGMLYINTAGSSAVDRIYLNKVEVTGSTTIRLHGGDDHVMITESYFNGDAEFELDRGADIFLIGQQLYTLLPGSRTTFAGHVIIDAGRGADQVGITKTDVSGLMFVQLGATNIGSPQQAHIAAVGGTFTARDLGIAGRGTTNVIVGNGSVTGPSVTIDRILSISTGMDRGHDSIVLQSTWVLGEVGISTGGGSDVLWVRWCTFEGPWTAHLGDGVDYLFIEENHFEGDTELHGDDGDDLMWIMDNTFYHGASFYGGLGADWINLAFLTANRFLIPGQPVADIEMRY
jgi:hypothetical protein